MRTVSVFLALALALAGCRSSLPKPVSDELARSPRGVVTIVFFTDFQCPHCRRMHALLRSILETRGLSARVVLRHVPLERHPDARPAARAAVCADKLIREGSAFADALFEMDDLSDASIEALAVRHGLSRESFVACVGDPSTDARIDHDVALFDELGGEGVPLVWIGRQRFEGTYPRSILDQAVDEALADAR